MRTFIILAAITITTAIYDIGGIEFPWIKGIGLALLLTAALACDGFERKKK